MTKEWGTTMNLFPAGYTTPSVDVEVTDDSGLPVTGLNASTFPTLKYSIAGANNSATLTLSDLTNENSAFTAQGVKERGEGVYRIDLPLAAVATVGSVVKLRGTASGKRVFCAPIVVMDMISAGLLNTNVTQWLGTAPAAPNIPGVPRVDITRWQGLTPNGLLGGRVETLPPVIRRSTAQAGTATSITLDAGASSVADFYAGCLIYIESGTGAGQPPRLCSSFNGTSKVAGIFLPWKVTPDNTSLFTIYAWVDSYTCANFTAVLGATNVGQTFTPYIGQQTLHISGTTSPNFNGVFGLSPASPYLNGKPAFVQNNVGSVYWDGTQWILGSPTVGIAGTNYWRSTGDETGPWTNGGGSTTGLPVVTPMWRPPTGKNPVLATVDSSGRTHSDLRSLLGTTLTETAAGYLAAGFKKLHDIATPIFTLASANQSGDSYGVVNDSSSGNAALAVLITNIKNNTFVRSTIPEVLERPDTGSKTVQMVFTYEDENGNAKNLDAGNPTITLVNDDSSDLSSRLGIWTNPATGKYCINYTSSVGDTIEGLHWDVLGTVNSKVRRYVAYMQVVDTTAVDFTSSDRTKLDSILTHATAADSQTVASAIRAALGLAAANLDSQLAGIGDAVWTTLTSAISTVGSFGLAFKNFVASYVSPPTASQIADTLFEDGSTNKLKVNSDHTANATVIGDVAIDISGIPPISIVVPAAIAVASQDPAVVTCLRGDTLRVSLPLMGNITDRTKLIMTAKSDLNDADDQAILQVVETTGLVRLNRAAAIVAEAASLTVQDATTGAVDLQIDATATVALAIQDLVWDVQVFSSSSISSPISGTMSVVADVTRAIN